MDPGAAGDAISGFELRHRHFNHNRNHRHQDPLPVPRFVRSYPTLKSQIQGLRQAELKQLSDVYRERVRTSQMTGNKMLMAQATYDYKMGMKKKGINTLIPMLNLFQIPILFTWFFSLRYLSNLPEVYPQILTEGYLWFSDLSTYDPYFVLPVLAACGTSLSIARSPNLARNNLSMPFLAPYVKYLKYSRSHSGSCPSRPSPSLASSQPP